MSRAIVLSLYLLLRSSVATPSGPHFTAEPPARVRFSPAAGTRIHCRASGRPLPTVTWLGEDGAPLYDVHEYRRIYANGTLEILPSSGHAPASYRCRASNVHGTVLSRDVTLQPVPDTPWEAVISAPAATLGGVAALTCSSSGSRELVQPALWYRGDRLLPADVARTDGRYLVAGDSLLIRDVTRSDAGAYSCVARHAVTGDTKRSRHAVLTVTDAVTSSSPRLIASAADARTSAGVDVCVPCVTDQRTPHYTWYRQQGGRLLPAPPSAWLWGGGAALCLPRPTSLLSGTWLCKADNVYGDVTAQTRLVVAEELRVEVTPDVQLASTGSTVQFNCTVSDPSASIWWAHDGAPVGGGSPQLVLRGVSRAQRGVYQCRARSGDDNAQAAGLLTLGDSGPELHYTFIEQALRGGGSVSLRCAASGAPPPRLLWLLDGAPVDQYLPAHRFSIKQETSLNGDVVSVLNISAATAADGGLYTCRAQNSLGQASHSARLNIYGPPSIRSLGVVRLVAGYNATVLCPYAGYPISSISWWAQGSERAIGVSGRVSAKGAELRFRPALANDAGVYACAVSAPGGGAARRELDLQLRNPPKISPFMFSSELTEGSSVQVLCGVISGDKPMYFSWLKDGAPLPSNLQIEEKSLNEFSLLMFSDLTARHSGEYTCKVSNHAAIVNYTATLSVKVAPSWTKEPGDTAVLLGAPVLLECTATGYPIPTVSWYRRIGIGPISSEQGSDQWKQVGAAGWDAGGEGLTGAGGALRASRATAGLAGLYRCRADNGVGPALVKHVNITVHEPAHFDSLEGASDRNISCVRGQSSTLTCNALGDAPLRVHWTHRGRKLDLNSYRSTVSEVRTADGLRSVLQLRSAERDDAGEYRCHAENEYGRSELLLYLNVEEPPSAPSSLRLGGVSSRWVILTWRAGPAPGVTYTALFTALHALAGLDTRHNVVNLTIDAVNGQDRLDQDGLMWYRTKLEGLRPAAAYSLRLAAGNHVGQSPHSEPLLFTTLEEAPSGSPQNVRVRPSSNDELHVSWSAPQQDSWNGELLGYAISWRELGRHDDSVAEDDVRRSGMTTSPGWSSAERAVTGLRPFARYAVTLRAYNSAGPGPASPPVYATTADGVPDVSPSEVHCDVLTSQSLRVRWTIPPGVHAQNLRGFDVLYAPLYFSHSWSGPLAEAGARAGTTGEVTLQSLRPATNYSISVRARSDGGPGPRSDPVSCTTLEDVPGAPTSIRALAAGPDSLLVSWLAPTLTALITHYMLYIRELGKASGEWSMRVETNEQCAGAASSLVRGLSRAPHELWVRAHSRAGPGAPSRTVSATPMDHAPTRISSPGGLTQVSVGARVRLCCVTTGAPAPRAWRPLPARHTITDSGDLIIHRAELGISGNYTCSVRGAGGGDSVTYSVSVLAPPPAPPAPRAATRQHHALHLAWDAPHRIGSTVLGYTVWWSTGAEARSWARVAGAATYVISGLACGAQYRVTLTAHNDAGVSPHSAPLIVKTRGDKAVPAPGKEVVWANSSSLRLTLLAWRAPCPARWSVALRAPQGGWQELAATGDTVQATGLSPGTWYEIRVVSHSTAGDTVALYRAATLTINGERIGEPIELPIEARTHLSEDGDKDFFWRGAGAPLLLGGLLAALLLALVTLVLLKRKGPCLKRECAPPQLCRPHQQLYSTEPGKRNGKTLSPPDDGSLHEISPYATFSMAGVGAGAGAGAATSCALHSFGRAEPPGLSGPPPRHLADVTESYSASGLVSRDSDSSSSGSVCAACALQYRAPHPHTIHANDTLPLDSSAESTTYNSGRAGSAVRGRGRGRRRRDHMRHSSGPTARYFSSATLQARQDEL